MSWSKLKTIILLILVALNLFLLVLVGSIQIQSHRYHAAALSEALVVLDQNGIHLDKADMPSSMDLVPISVTRNTDLEAEIARTLLGENVTITNSGAGLNLYTSSVGSANFRSNGDFAVTFNSPPAADGSESLTEYARQLFGRMGLQLWTAIQSGSTVTAVQALEDGTPVFSSTGIVFQFQDGALVSLAGRIVLGPISTEADPDAPITVPTALITFLNFIKDSGDVCRSIESMTAGYLSASTLTDPVRMTPVWRIATDTADYYLDAYTAEVTRIT